MRMLVYILVLATLWCGHVIAGQPAKDSYTIAMLGNAPAMLSALNGAGYHVEAVDFNDFVNSKVSAAKYGCVVFTHSQRFPYAGRQCLLTYLRQGGDIITMGGYAFQTPVFESSSKWYSSDELASTLAGSAADMFDGLDINSVELASWSRDCDDPRSPSSVKIIDGSQGKCLAIDIRNFVRWDTFGGNFASKNGHNALVLELKGSENLKDTVVEIRERDGSRWYQNVLISGTWHQCVAFENDFKFIVDGSPATRGKDGDHLRMDQAAGIRFGLVLDVSPKPRGDYRIMVKRAATARIDLPQGFGSQLFDDVPPVFYDQLFHRYAGKFTLKTYSQQDIIGKMTPCDMNVIGISALGFNYADESVYVPLIEIDDVFGRRAGFAGGVLVHYNGQYKDGNWLIFGVEDEEFYRSSIFIDTTISTMARLAGGSYAHACSERNAAARQKFESRGETVLPRLKVSANGRSIVDANGQKFFMVGVNYVGSNETTCSQASTNFFYDTWETDFKRAHDAGINCMRLWIEGIDGRRNMMDSIIHLANKYRIYLLLHPMAHPLEKSSDLEAVFASLAEMVDNNPVVLGYDLMNEPYITMIGSIRINGQLSEISRYNAYNRHANGSFYNKEWVDTIVRTRTGWPELASWVGADEARSLYTAHDILNRYSSRFIPATDFSSLVGLDCPMNIEPAYEPIVEAVDNTFSKWIEDCRTAIRKHDSNGLITVGYNSVLESLDANKKLDFVSHHLYQRPMSFEDMNKAVTTFDRLTKICKNKPITLGEFGYTYGLKLTSGEYLDIYTAGMAEAMIYFYAFANDYSGARAWMLSDWPVPLLDRYAPWIGQLNQGYEAGFGMYYYDGTNMGHPKPVVYATRFLSDYQKTHQSGTGKFSLLRAATPVGCGYIYEANDAYCVGGREFFNDKLSMKSTQTTNLLIYCPRSLIKVVASSDAQVNLKTALLKKVFNDQTYVVSGKFKKHISTNDGVVIDLLEGEYVTITPSPIKSVE